MGRLGFVCVVALSGALAVLAGCKEATKQLKKGKSMESHQNLRKIIDGARAYYAEEVVAPGSMAPQTHQLPPSAGPTPPLGACCAEGSSGKCAPAAEPWNEETWVALNFAMNDAHYFSYEFKVADDKQSVTAYAYGDLDCDGDFSTYSLTAVVGPSGELESAGTVAAENAGE